MTLLYQPSDWNRLQRAGNSRANILFLPVPLEDRPQRGLTLSSLGRSLWPREGWGAPAGPPPRGPGPCHRGSHAEAPAGLSR